MATVAGTGRVYRRAIRGCKCGAILAGIGEWTGKVIYWRIVAVISGWTLDAVCQVTSKATSRMTCDASEGVSVRAGRLG